MRRDAHLNSVRRKLISRPPGAISDCALSVSDRSSLINGLGAGTETRTSVLRKVSENAAFTNQQFNRAFMLMQYFGYLRRDPDTAGFNFWLTKLNTFGGDFRHAEMVRAFLSSSECRQRFGLP